MKPDPILLNDLRLVAVKGVLNWRLRCPVCGLSGYLTDDQVWGRDTVTCCTGGCAWRTDFDFGDLVLRKLTR